jgi:hypothetical protein
LKKIQYPEKQPVFREPEGGCFLKAADVRDEKPANSPLQKQREL